MYLYLTSTPTVGIPSSKTLSEYLRSNEVLPTPEAPNINNL